MQSIYLRKVPNEVAARFKEAAGARMMNSTEYLVALVQLHARLRAVLDDPSGHRRGLDDIRELVDDLGLATVKR